MFMPKAALKPELCCLLSLLELESELRIEGCLVADSSYDAAFKKISGLWVVEV